MLILVQKLYLIIFVIFSSFYTVEVLNCWLVNMNGVWRYSGLLTIAITVFESLGISLIKKSVSPNKNQVQFIEK